MQGGVTGFFGAFEKIEVREAKKKNCAVVIKIFQAKCRGAENIWCSLHHFLILQGTSWSRELYCNCFSNMYNCWRNYQEQK